MKKKNTVSSKRDLKSPKPGPTVGWPLSGDSIYGPSFFPCSSLSSLFSSARSLWRVKIAEARQEGGEESSHLTNTL